MATSPQQSQAQQQGASAVPKSVWKKFNDSTASSSSQPHVNGITDEAHERDSVSSKDVAHGEGSSQGHSTPASSMTENEIQPASPTPPAPTPVYRPAPLPTVNPWKIRKEEMERKRWKESQETPLVPLPVERSVPKPPTSAASKPHASANRPNGIPKSDGINHLSCFADISVVRAPARRSTKMNSVAPPALEDAEAWPSPDVAANAEKEERSRSTTSTSTKDTGKERPKESKEGESREVKEPRESTKKKKWEKLEVNITINPPPHMNRRGRGGKINRSGRGGARESSGRGRDIPADRIEREEKSRNAPRSDGEDASLAAGKESAVAERGAQSLSFDPGHRPHEIPPSEWTVNPAVHEPEQLASEGWQGDSSPSFHPNGDSNVSQDLSTTRSRSPGSVGAKTSSSPAGSKRGNSQEPHHSPSGSHGGRAQVSETSNQWEEHENASQQNHAQLNQQSNAPRRGTGRGYRGRNTYTPNAFPQGQYMPPQQLPYQGFYPVYSPPMQPGFAPSARSQSVPYYQPHSPSRYPQAGYVPQWIPGTSQLGLQPVPMVAIDEDMKQRIVYQVYVSPISLC
jgi:la-related protein 1